MVKFRLTINDKPVIGFGLSETNINNLKKDMPIHITPEDMKNLFGIECPVLIMYGNTEEKIVETLKTTFDHSTLINE